MIHIKFTNIHALNGEHYAVDINHVRTGVLLQLSDGSNQVRSIFNKIDVKNLIKLLQQAEKRI